PCHQPRSPSSPKPKPPSSCAGQPAQAPNAALKKWLPNCSPICRNFRIVSGQNRAARLGLPPSGSLVASACEIHREIGRSGVVRVQILGFALPPVSLRPRALLEGNISCFGLQNEKSVLARRA